MLTEKSFLSIGNSFSKIYGQSLNFTHNPVRNPIIHYNPILNVIAFPWQQNEPEFKVTTNASKFIKLSGTAPILQSYWFLPTAQIDVAHPLEAKGNGGVILHCDKGLRVSWPNLVNDDARLVQPLIMGSPGNLSISDYAADALGASQHYDLWQDEQNP